MPFLEYMATATCAAGLGSLHHGPGPHREIEGASQTRSEPAVRVAQVCESATRSFAPPQRTRYTGGPDSALQVSPRRLFVGKWRRVGKCLIVDRDIYHRAFRLGASRSRRYPVEQLYETPLASRPAAP